MEAIDQVELEFQMSCIRWHIEANFYPPYKPEQVDGMCDLLRKYYRGEISLHSWIDDAMNNTVAELLNELKLEP